jgi:hypothetical protein
MNIAALLSALLPAIPQVISIIGKVKEISDNPAIPLADREELKALLDGLEIKNLQDLQ